MTAEMICENPLRDHFQWITNTELNEDKVSGSLANDNEKSLT